MLIIPAVDIKNGKCVRLYQGREDMVKEYSDDPVEMAIFWESQGAERIHIVDLEGAMRGYPVHKEVIFNIRKSVKGVLQVGGGIRKERDIMSYVSAGIDYIVVSTILFQNLSILKEITVRYPKRIMLSVDIRGNRASIEGWRKDIELNQDLIVRILNELPLAGVIVTNVEKDGTLRGVSFDEINGFIKSISHPVYIAGGITSYKDITHIKEKSEGKVKGVIIGKALYEGRMELSVALRIGGR